MAKFNSPRVTSLAENRVANHVGALAWKYEDKMELLTTALTTFAEDSYYASSNETLSRIRQLLDCLPLSFSARVALYARNTFHMRSISHVLAVEIARRLAWRSDELPNARRFFYSVVERVDDITEILARYTEWYGKPLPASLRRGLADSFNKFDNYQIAKYRSSNKNMALVDAVNLLHPRPTSKNSEGLAKLVNGTLRNTDTWESKLSFAGQQDDVLVSKNAAWSELISNNKLGYMALLRNLRNILLEAPELIDTVCDTLANKKAVLNSKQLPFRFLSAYQQVSMVDCDKKKQGKVLKALEKAIDYSVQNIPFFGGQGCHFIRQFGKHERGFGRFFRGFGCVIKENL